MTPSALLVALAVALLLAPAATAHATAYNTQDARSYQVKFMYGNLDEPAATFQRTGLDLGVFDPKGTPIDGLACADSTGTPLPNPPIRLTLTISGQSLDMSRGCTAQEGRDGWYTFPLIYTKAGAYALRVTGTINGTAVDVTIPPAHAVEDAGGEMFPAKVDTPDASAARIGQLTDQNSLLAREVGQLSDAVAALRVRVNSLEGQASKGAPGTGGGLLVLGLLAALGLAATRRSA